MWLAKKFQFYLLKKNIIWNKNWKRLWRERPQCAS